MLSVIIKFMPKGKFAKLKYANHVKSNKNRAKNT